MNEIRPLSRDDAFFVFLGILNDYRRNPHFTVEIAQECLRAIDGIIIQTKKDPGDD